jgi:hypothetical protein
MTHDTQVLRTWKSGAFASGVLLLGAQVASAVQGSAIGSVVAADGSVVDAEDVRILTKAFELSVDVAVQAGGLTAWRVLRWREGQTRKR